MISYDPCHNVSYSTKGKQCLAIFLKDIVPLLEEPSNKTVNVFFVMLYTSTHGQSLCSGNE